jgi:hypothetical protein
MYRNLPLPTYYSCFHYEYSFVTSDTILIVKCDIKDILFVIEPTFRIRIRGICKFLGHPDPYSSVIESEVLIWVLPSLSKNTKKNLDFYFLRLLYDFLSLKNDVNVPLNVIFKNNIFVDVLEVTDEKSRIRTPELDSDPLVRGADPEPYQNVTDPKHCIIEHISHVCFFQYHLYHLYDTYHVF